MTFTVPLALFGWLAVSVLIFAAMPPRRAAVACVVGGTLFLPIAGISGSGLPDYGKHAAIALGLLLGIIAFDAKRLSLLRLRWFDLPIVLWTVVPFATSLSNDLGAYDGLSSVYGAMLMWTIPYFVGRIYFRTPTDINDLAVGIVVGGLVYVPLCLIEIRLSPQLHTWIYGFHQHQFAQTKRFGGFRPTVFMKHGLSVSLWMAGATLTCAWLWASGAVRAVAGVPVRWATFVLMVTMILCKSVGATVLMVVGLGALALARVWRTRWVLVALLAFPVIYSGLRVAGLWSFSTQVEWSRAVAGDVAAGSLRFRLDNEIALIHHALERQWLGWGGWGRSRPPERGLDVITDGMWVIALSQNGLIGLASYLSAVLVPASIVALRFHPARWRTPVLGAAIGIAYFIGIYAVDSLFNTNLTQVYHLAGGALATVAGSSSVSRLRAPRSRKAQHT